MATAPYDIDPNTPIRPLSQPKRRERIEAHDSVHDILIKLSEGNPGALTALIEVVKDDPVMGFMDLLHLDDMGMRGPQIWVAYKDHCKQDRTAFVKAIRERDQAMVNTVNASRGVGDVPPAVTHGASFR